MKKYLLLALFFICFSNFIKAEVYFVRNTFETGSESIGEALSLSVDGDTIIIDVSGTLVLNNPLVIDKGLTILGPSPRHFTIDGANITGTPAVRVNVPAGATAVLNGIKFANYAGPISMLENIGDELKIVSCVFKGNMSGSTGGAISNSGIMLLQAVSFSNNSASTGGGAIHSTGQTTMQNCSFHFNNTPNDGGAVLIQGGVAQIELSTFYQNQADQNGSGLAVEGGSVELGHSIFDNTGGFPPNYNVHEGAPGLITSNGRNLMLDGENVQDIQDVGGGGSDLVGGIYNLGLRPSGVVVDGYGMEWIPITDNSSSAISQGGFPTHPTDIRRAPRIMSDLTQYIADCGAVEYTPFRVISNGIGAGNNGTLEWAVDQVNAFSISPAYISFDLPGSTTINNTVTYQLDIDHVYIDGYTQPGSAVPGPQDMTNAGVAGAPTVFIFQSGGDAFLLPNTCNDTWISGLTINGAQNAIVCNAPSCHFFGNHIGIDINGNNIIGNNGIGILMGTVDATDFLIGGYMAHERNVLSGNAVNVVVETGASSGDIAKNFIGIDAWGMSAPTGVVVATGVLLSQSNDIFVEENVISSLDIGVNYTGTSNTGHCIGNYIGTDGWGEGNLPITNVGINLENQTSAVQIGEESHGNLIGNCSGVAGVFVFNCNANIPIQGNRFGLSYNNTPIQNTRAIYLSGSSNIIIGGSGNGEGNIIAGSSGAGVYFENGSVSNTIIHNLFGLDESGMSSAGYENQHAIHLLNSNNNLIGVSGAPNFIAASNAEGILIDNSDGTDIEHNFIGVNQMGSPVFNFDDGIQVVNSDDTQIGILGTTHNVIANNSGAGIGIVNSTNTTIENDSIFNNTSHGVHVDQVGSTQNSVNHCWIYNNGGLGIDLQNVANIDIPAPTINGASVCSAVTSLRLTVPAGFTGNASFEFYRIPNGSEDPSGFGEGNEPLFTTTSFTIAGPWSNNFNVTGLSAGDFVSVIMTDVNGNSSEFSNHIEVQGQPAISFSNGNVTCHGGNDGTCDATVSGGSGELWWDWDVDGVGDQDDTEDMASLTAGSYAYQYMDNAGCMLSGTETITEPTQVLMGTAVPTDETCTGNSDGTITITGESGGISPYTYSIDGGGSSQGSNIFTSLAAGSYLVTVIDAVGCISDTVNVTINPASSVTISGAVTSNYNGSEISCNGLTDGEVTVTISGGILPYTLNVNGSFYSNPTGTSEVVTGLGDGPHSFEIIDGNGCSNTDVVVVTEPSAVSHTFGGQSTVSCFGGSDGSLVITPLGGTGSYTYDWDYDGTGDFDDPQTPIGILSAGNYNVVIQDANGCSDTGGPYTVNQPPAITITPDALTNPSCNGAVDGSISVTVVGGDGGPYTYDWDNDGTGDFDDVEDITSLGDGSYNLVAQDGNGCLSTSYNYTLTEPAPITVDAGVAQTICEGDNVTLAGAVTVATGGVWSGGTGVFSPSATTLNATYTPSAGDIAAGTVTLTLQTTGNGSCPAQTDDMILTIESQPDAGTPAPITVCNTDGGVNLDLQLSGQDGGGTWDDVNTTGALAGNVFSPTGVTVSSPTNFNFSYIVTGSVCSNDTATVVVTVNPTPVFTVSTNDPSTCGANDGSFVLSGLQGNTTYDVNIDGAGAASHTSDATGNITVGGYGQGTYTGIDVVDAFGCSYSDAAAFTLTDPAPPSFGISNSTDPTTCGGTDGTITISGLAPSTSYDDLSYDDGGGTVSLGAITTNAAGEFVITGLGNDVFSNFVVTQGGCTGNDPGPIGLFNPPLPTIDSVTDVDPSCAGNADGSITISASGGGALEYSIDEGAFYQASGSFVSLPANQYIIWVQDQVTGCVSLPDTVNLISPTPITATFTTTDVSCFGNCDGQIQVTASGGTGTFTNYTWTPIPGAGQGTNTITSLCAGTYSVTIEDSNGCTHTPSSETVNQPTQLLSTSSATAESCLGANDGTLTLDVSGGTSGFTINWYSDVAYTTLVYTNAGVAGPNTVTSVVPGMYYPEVIDANGCIHYAGPAVVNTGQVITVTITPSNESCFGAFDGTAAVTNVSGGSGSYSYSWYDDASLVTPIGGSAAIGSLGADWYYVIVTDQATSCSTVDSVEITSPPQLVYETPTLIDPSCNGIADGAIQGAASGGNPPYLISTDGGNSYPYGGLNATGLAGGSYQIYIQDANGCVSGPHTEVLIDPAPILLSVTATDIKCFGDGNGQIDISFSGGVPAYLTTIDNGTNQNNIGSTTNDTYTGLGQGSYTVFIEDANGCLSADTTVTVNEPADLTITADTTGLCLPSLGELDIVAGGGTPSYVYSTNGIDYQSSANFDTLLMGTYYAYVQDASGCIDSVQFTIAGYIPPSPSILNNQFCEGEPYEVNGNGVGTLVWSTDSLFSSQFTGNPGIFPVGMQDGDLIALAALDQGCFSLPTYETIIIETSSMVMGPDQVVCPGDSVMISASISAGTFLWTQDGTIADPSLTSIYVTSTSDFTYYEAKNTIGTCTFIDSVLVTIDVNNPDCGNSIANAFSPDGDGVNDIWVIDGIIDSPNNAVHIINRWGDEVFSVSNYDNTSVYWDGKDMSGNDLSAGTYFYVIEYIDEGSSVSGWVQIVR